MQTQTLLLTLATLTAALAGCTGDDGAQGPDATTPPDEPGMPLDGDNGTLPAPGEPTVKITSWDGHITAGAGVPTPSGHQPVEVSVSPAGSFRAGDGATGILVELTWTPVAGVVPTDMHLAVLDPDGNEHLDDEGLPGMPDGPASLFLDDPAAGTWVATGWTNGATVMQDYTIHASVFYGGEMPEGYTAVR